MWDFSIRRSIDMMVKTMPFILFRMAVYFAIAAAYVIVTGTGAGIGWGVGAFGDPDFQANATFWGGLIGFGATAGIIYLLREYILYIVKAGHIAVMVEYLDGKLVLQGADDGLEDVRDGAGWTMSINESTGEMVMTTAGDGFAVVVFGACALR